LQKIAVELRETCAEWRLKRPWALERLVDREYKAIMRKRAQQFPTLAAVEQGEKEKE
jgi:hypothetical protein